jgi:DNA-directed RNA polymerase specialized sigma24 family protein
MVAAAHLDTHITAVPRVPGLHPMRVRAEIRWWRELDAYVQPVMRLERPPWAPPPPLVPVRADPGLLHTAAHARRAPPVRGRTARPARPPTPDRSLGVDLARHWEDVRRMYYRCFARRVALGSGDHEDVIQDVYASLLARNQGEHPWDPQRAPLPRYLYLVIQSVVMNRADKVRRSVAVEPEDAGSSVPEWWGQDLDLNAVADACGLDDTELEAVRGWVEGCTAAEIGSRTGMRPSSLYDLKKRVRETIR